MENIIKHDAYPNRLIGKKENGLIKVITGIRRCGKSFCSMIISFKATLKRNGLLLLHLMDDIYLE